MLVNHINYLDRRLSGKSKVVNLMLTVSLNCNLNRFNLKQISLQQP